MNDNERVVVDVALAELIKRITPQNVHSPKLDSLVRRERRLFSPHPERSA
jgi:hypothetical protein